MNPAFPNTSVDALESVLCTEELHRRPARAANYKAENSALRSLTEAVVSAPGNILQTLAEKILDILSVDTAGVSLLSDDGESFYWSSIAGAWKSYAGGGTPRNFGPCGDVLDRNAPQLFAHPERRYAYLNAAMPSAEECLLVPFFIDGKAIGTIWAITHQTTRKFDAEDLRQLESLGQFASAAYRAYSKAIQEQRRDAQRLAEAVQAGQAIETVYAELRGTHEALRRSEGELRDFIENAAIGLQWVRPDGIIIWANQTELDIHGYARDEYFGRNITEFHADPAVIADILSRFASGETLVDYEARLRRKDGSFREVLISSNGLFENEGFAYTRCFTRDITARKLVDNALRESEAFNRSIIESSPDCIKVLATDGTLLSMLTGQQLLGIDHIEPYLNTSWFDFWEGDHRRAAQSAVALAATGVSANFEGFFPTLRGEPKWWDVAVSPVFDASGKTEHLLAVSRDVTVRKRGELNRELLGSIGEELLHFTSVGDMMQTVGAKLGEFLKLSICAFVEIDEASEQVVISHDWHRPEVPSLVGVHALGDFVGPAFIRAARSGQIIVVHDTVTDARTEPEKFSALSIASFICVPLIRDGEWRFALCLYHSEPHVWQIDEVELARELTARVWTRLGQIRAEEILRESEVRYRTLFSSIDEGFCVIEMVFDEHDRAVDYRFLEVNPTFERQIGLHAATGKLVSELVPNLEPYWYEIYGKVARTGEAVRFVNEVKALHRWLDIYACRFGPPDSRKVAVVFNDITERRRAEKKSRESAEALLELDRRKDEFLAMLSHELRNPLAPLSNAVHILRLQQTDDPLQQQARNIIERQVGQLTHLVDDLLEISRVTSGRLQLRQERIVVSGIVERAVETTQPLIEQRRHQLTVSLPPEPIWLNADAARMEQVVVNLLTNAAKYTREGGQIWLTVLQEGPTMVLRVRDTGVGIAAEFLPRIFDLFTQAERSLDRSQGGLGIGLCLVKRLVDLHGGSVEAHSILGQGSEFVVRVPVTEAALPAQSLTISIDKPATKRCRVLVVDDNVDTAQSLGLLLKASGHEVHMAHDGPTAVAAAVLFQPDVALMDIGLPGFDGYRAAAEMRQQVGLEQAILVAMTGYGQEKDRLRSEQAGFDHHLVKPVNFDKVQNILALVSAR